MNTYCVPYSLAKLTGQSPDHIAELVRRYYVAHGYGNKPVRGVQRVIYHSLFAGLGIVVLAKIHKPGMTLESFARLQMLRGQTGPWLIKMTHHLLIYREGKFYDNGHPRGVPVSEYRFRRSRLLRAELVNIWNDQNPYEV